MSATQQYPWNEVPADERAALVRHIAEQGDEAGFAPEIVAAAKRAARGLTWNEAVEAAMEPTDLDRTLGAPGRIGPDGKVAEWGIVRERAALAYLEAHEGEHARVTYCDPEHVADRERLVYTADGILARKVVTFPTWPGWPRGFVIGTNVIPFAGLSSIRIDGDHSTVVL